MPYTVPAGNDVALAFSGAYTVPDGNLVGLAFEDPAPPLPAPIRYTQRSVGLPWQRAARRARQVRSVYRIPPPQQGAPHLPWSVPEACTRAIDIVWRLVDRRGTSVEASWQDAPRHGADARLPWMHIPLRAHSDALRWGSQPRRAHAAESAWRAPPRHESDVGLVWGTPPRHVVDAGLPYRNPPAVFEGRTLPWGNAPPLVWSVPGPGVDPPIEPPSPGYTPPAGNAVGLDFVCPQVEFDGAHVPLPLGPAACYFAWPKPRTYIVLNTAAVVRLPERTPIAVSGGSIRAGVDDVYVSFTLELADATHLALLLADADGPKSVEINLNGYVWTGIVEDYGQDRQFPGRRVSVSGRSRTALLDAPYAPARAKVELATRSAHQLVDAELDLTGFTADYGTLDWIVPGGVWHYDGLTAAAAVREIAAAAGAVVQSHAWDDVLRIRPRYPASPWAWSVTAPDKQIPDDIILRDQLRLAGKPLYDYVLVSGEQVGVSDPILREGSAGNVRAPMVVDALITEHPVARERGRNVLSDRGQQALVEVTIPLFPASAPGMPGYIAPLQLIEVIEPVAWKALATAVQITFHMQEQGAATVLVIEQTVTLERHYDDAG